MPFFVEYCPILIKISFKKHLKIPILWLIYAKTDIKT